MSVMSAQSAAETGKNSDNRSVHSDNVEEVHNVPLNVLIRPIPPVLDELKVQSLIDTIKVIYLVPKYIYSSTVQVPYTNRPRVLLVLIQ